jgi:hypothetical protein
MEFELIFASLASKQKVAILDNSYPTDWPDDGEYRVSVFGTGTVGHVSTVTDQ